MGLSTARKTSERCSNGIPFLGFVSDEGRNHDRVKGDPVTLRSSCGRR